MIVGVVGLIGSGKDTAGAALVKAGWHRLAFGDHVRALAFKINPYVPEYGTTLQKLVTSRGWDEIKRDAISVRELLQNIGNECRNAFGENVWVDKVAEEYAGVEDDVVITDVRYPNEVDFIKGEGGVVIWVEREGVVPVNNHISERLNFAEVSDYKVRNDGSVSELEKEFIGLVDKIKEMSDGEEVDD